MDFVKCVGLAAAVFCYWKGYGSFLGGTPQMTAAWAAGCGACLLFTVRRSLYVRYLHMKMDKVDGLSGRAFEQFLAAQFRHLGYRVEETEASHDYGADLLLRKKRELIVVQAKRYERNVGISAVQQVVGAVAYYGADRAMVVTNSGFTKSARNLARQNDVELWDRQEIVRRFSVRE